MLLLATIQHKATLWILGAFCTSPTGEIEALAGLIPIQLHFKKLVKQSCLWTATLPSQHALMSLLSAKNSKGTKHTSLPLITTIVNSKNLNKSIKSPTLPSGLQDSSQHIGESLDFLNFLSRTSSRASKQVYSRERLQTHYIARHFSKSVSASSASRNLYPEALFSSSLGESEEKSIGSGHLETDTKILSTFLKYLTGFIKQYPIEQFPTILGVGSYIWNLLQAISESS